MKQLTLAGRLVFGAWMLIHGANHFFLSLWPAPAGHEQLSIELMNSLIHSRLLDVSMLIQLVTGALILSGFFVPLALCIVMPISTCALYWALLDVQPLGAVLALAAFALNGLLMLSCIEYYKGVLQPSATTFGETENMRWDSLFVNPNGRTTREQFIAALIPLVIVVVSYARGGPGAVGPWNLFILLFPTFVLHARRLHDIGYSAWLLLAPVLLSLIALAIWRHYLNLGARLDTLVPLVAAALFAGFALWCCLSKGQTEANRFGGVATA